MPEKPHNFWQELKRRKVFRVIIGYAAASYVILELISIIAEPFGLPVWTLRLVFVLLCVGFIIAVVLSWIYDFTPKGIEKTKPAKVIREDEPVLKPVKRKLRLSDIIILILLVAVIILVYPKIFKRDTLERLRVSDERISVAVMPFQNMTNDTIWNVWQEGIQDILISSLINSEELKVRQPESLKSLIQSKGLTNYASITPSVASDISNKLDADVFISGSIKKAGSQIRIDAQLINSKTQEALKSFEIDGPSDQEMIFQIIDSLKYMVGNYLIISKLKKELPFGFRYYESTNSPEAFRYYIQGLNTFYKKDFSSAASLFSQAVAIDSNFTSAAIKLAISYHNLFMFEEAKEYCMKLYEKRDQLSYKFKIQVNHLYAGLFETPYEQIEIVRQLLEIDDQSPKHYYNLGFYYWLLRQDEKAIPEFETALGIYKRWKIKPMWAYNYILLGDAYHEMEQYNKERKLYKEADKDFPGDIDILTNKAILAFAEGDTVLANEFIRELISILKDQSFSEVDIAINLAHLYDRAGIWDMAKEYYSEALSIVPENPERLNGLSRFLIHNDLNIEEGLDLVEKALFIEHDNYIYLDTKGWGLYKQGKYQEALDILERSWELKPVYDHDVFLHLEAAKKAVADQNSEQ